MSDQSNSFDRPDDLEAGTAEVPGMRALVGRLMTHGHLWQSRLPNAVRVAERMRAIPWEVPSGGSGVGRSVTSKRTDTTADRLRPPSGAGPAAQPGPGVRLLGLVAAVVVALIAAVLARLASSEGTSTVPTATPTPARIPTPSPTQSVGPVAVPGAVGVVPYLNQPSGANMLLLTTDGGAHWKNVAPPGTPAYGTLDGYCLNTELGWAAWGSPDHPPLLLFHTTDGGHSWRQAQLPPVSGSELAWGILAMSFFDAQHGWLEVGTGGGNLSAFGQLYVTSDGGTSWTQAALPFGGGMIFTTPSTGFLVGSHVSTLRNQFDMTRNGGQTW